MACPATSQSPLISGVVDIVVVAMISACRTAASRSVGGGGAGRVGEGAGGVRDSGSRR